MKTRQNKRSRSNDEKMMQVFSHDSRSPTRFLLEMLRGSEWLLISHLYRANFTERKMVDLTKIKVLYDPYFLVVLIQPESTTDTGQNLFSQV